MKCPKCNVDMAPKKVGPLISVNLDECPTCNGT
jgi:Zn-finger nucleic acid-binding protein